MKKVILRSLRFVGGGILLVIVSSVLGDYFSRSISGPTVYRNDLAAILKILQSGVPFIGILSATVVTILSVRLIKKEEQFSFALWSCIIGFIIHILFRMGGIMGILLTIADVPGFFIICSITFTIMYGICFIAMLGMFKLLNLIWHRPQDAS